MNNSRIKPGHGCFQHRPIWGETGRYPRPGTGPATTRPPTEAASSSFRSLCLGARLWILRTRKPGYAVLSRTPLEVHPSSFALCSALGFRPASLLVALRVGLRTDQPDRQSDNSKKKCTCDDAIPHFQPPVESINRDDFNANSATPKFKNRATRCRNRPVPRYWPK
jgi:hypothetical protein